MQEGNTSKTLVDIPGVGPAIAEKLRECGYTNLISIAITSPKDLAEICEIGVMKASEIIEGAKLCVDIGGFEKSEGVNARISGVKKLTTGSSELDKLLGGGLSSGSIVEIFGNDSSCITKFCHQLAVYATLSEKRGGFDSCVLFINSSETFRDKLVTTMAERLGADPLETLEKILFKNTSNSNEQIFFAIKAKEFAKKNKVNLLIVDTLTFHFLNEFVGRGAQAEKQKLLNRFMQELKDFALSNNAVVVVTNQANNDPNKPVGGRVVERFIDYRLFFIKGRGDERTIKLITSPNLPEGKATFLMSDSGISDRGK